MKETIIKSVTVFLCVGAICVSSVIGIGKYSNAVVEAAKNAPAAVAASGSSTAGSTGTDEASTPSGGDQTIAPDASGTDVTDPAADASGSSSTDSSSSTGSGSSSTGSTGGSSAAAADPTKYSKEQVVAYYNNAIKATAKAKKVTIVKTENISIVVDTMKPDSSALKKIINENVLSKYAKPSTYTDTFTNGVAANKTKIDAFLPKSQLQAAGAKSASITKSGSNYVVTIVTVAEKTTLENPTPKYAEQCAAPLDLASVDLGPIKIVQADMNYPGVTLKATVNANGTLVSSSINQPLNGTGTASVIGLKPSATVHGAWTMNNTYKY